MFNKSSKVAVLDLTHGGTVLAKKLKKIASSVAAIDVYKTLSNKQLQDLKNEGIKTALTPLKAEDFDFIVAPVHLDANYPMLLDAVKNNVTIISHHEAAGEILSHYDLKDKTLIEITGTKAKTSTSVLLAEILSREKKVVSHTSRGVEDWSNKKLIKKGLSTTPASILAALDEIEEAGVEFEVLISELSLGGTGKADIGVITTIANDYKIANNTKLASDAKRQMILNAKKNSRLVINNDALRFFGACRRDVEIISFTDEVNASCNVYYEDSNIAYFLGKKQGRIRIKESNYYDINAYKTAFACATAIALSMCIDSSTIERSIQEFKGAEGRMKKTFFEGKVLIDNSNSGMNIENAEKALSFSKSQGKSTVMLLGEEAKEVCEGLEPLEVKNFIQKHLSELKALVLVGERMKPLVKGNIHYAEDLSGGLKLAKELTKEKEIILSCVKCFR